MIRFRCLLLFCWVAFDFTSMVYGYDHSMINIPSSTRKSCGPYSEAVSKLSLDINELFQSIDGVPAPCRDPSPPTVAEMEEWIENWADDNNVSEQTPGIRFEDESPKLIELFQKFKLPKSATLNHPEGSGCRKVICAAQESFGDKEGLQLLYMLAKYGFNGSPYAHKGKKSGLELWHAEELDNILVALSDFPEGQLPVVENRSLIHFKRDSTHPSYEKLENSDPFGNICIGANAVIEVFSCIGEKSDQDYQQTIFHEIAHIIGAKYGLDESAAWYSFADWEETTVPNGGHGFNTNYKTNNPKCLVSPYAGTNPVEDFSESVVAYRHNPKPMKESCPEKYAFLKDLVFGGIEYLDEGGCKDKKLPQRWSPGTRWIPKKVSRVK